MKKALKQIFLFTSTIIIIACFIFKYTNIKLAFPGLKNRSQNSQENTILKEKLQQPTVEKMSVKKNNTTEKIQEIKNIDTLLTTLTKKEPTVIMGTMDHCHFCKQAKPIFQSYPAQFPHIGFFIANGPKTNMGQIVYKETNSAIAIRGYPAFLFIKDGEIKDHLLGTNIEKLENKLSSL